MWSSARLSRRYLNLNSTPDDALDKNKVLTQLDLSHNEIPPFTQQKIEVKMEGNRERASALRRQERREKFTMFAEEFKSRQFVMQVLALLFLFIPPMDHDRPSQMSESGTTVLTTSPHSFRSKPCAWRPRRCRSGDWRGCGSGW